jgi:hypothetical protein
MITDMTMTSVIIITIEIFSQIISLQIPITPDIVSMQVITHKLIMYPGEKVQIILRQTLTEMTEAEQAV